MRNSLLTFTLATALLGGLTACKKSDSSGGSGPAVLLKAKWPVGNRYIYRMDLDQQTTSKVPQMPSPIKQNMLLAMTYSLSVLKETPEGGRELEMEFLANEIEVKIGEQVLLTFDSKESGKDQPLNPAVAPFQKMVGSKVRLQVEADGKVEKVIGLEEWLNNLGADQGGPGGQMLTSQFNEGFFRQIADMGRMFSTKPVKAGESWPFKMDIPMGPTGKIAIDATIAFKRFEDHENRRCAVLASKGTMQTGPGGVMGPVGKMTIDQGKLAGTSWFDAELGAMIDSSSDQVMHIKGDVPTAPGGNQPPIGFTADIQQKVTVKLVELGKAKG